MLMMLPSRLQQLKQNFEEAETIYKCIYFIFFPIPIHRDLNSFSF